MTVKLLTGHHLAFLSFIEGCTGSYESTLAKMSHCWKLHVAAYEKLCLRNEYLKDNTKLWQGSVSYFCHR